MAFKVASVAQDMAEMSKETGTAVLSYNDIHRTQVNNELHFDYKKVIDSVSKAKHISSTEAEKLLLEKGALTPMPNGEYMVRVGHSTEHGGGRNIGNGTVFFTFSEKDKHNQYHEMAHSYQAKDNLFNDAAMDKMYAVSEKGLGSGEQGKLADRDTYKTYLKEAHAEIFAQTALMLRKNSALGFGMQALYAQSLGEFRNTAGFMIGGALGDQAMKYVCKPVMHAAIKEVAAIRKNGQRAEYFNPDGTLNAAKVSKLCEDIVLKNAYSPRTYQAFRNRDFSDTHTSEEKGWRKGTALAMIKSIPASCVLIISDSAKNIQKAIEQRHHKVLKKDAVKKLEAMTAKRPHNDNPQFLAANDYAYVAAKMQLIADKSPALNAADIVAQMAEAMRSKEMSATDFKEMASALYIKSAAKDFQDIYAVMQQNKDNSHFQAIMDNPANMVEERHEQLKAAKPIRIAPEAIQEVSLSDKEKIAALSGRTSAKPHYAVQDSEPPVKTLTAEQARTAALQVKSEPAQTAAPQKSAAEQSAQSGEKVADMSKQGKGTFLHNLRMGVNTILNKAEQRLTAVQSTVKIQTNAQQHPNAAQIKMAQTQKNSR
ncbi:MAG: hypothetical protein IJ738_02610 [Alphaproteobacteria bacterium]|nr:hypothetical protein [Alphaproteobacteria bacterium]